MFDDTALMRMVIEDLADAMNWSFEEAIDRFYKSNVCKGISDAQTGMFTYSPREVVELFIEEIACP